MNYSKIIKYLPKSLVNLGISAYNWKEYKKRYGVAYRYYRSIYANNRSLTLDQLKSIQADKYKELVKYAYNKSPFYYKLYKDLDFDIADIANIARMPIVSKEDIRANISDLYTIPENQSVVGKTGGTTGKSLSVRFSSDNIQERFAILDNFRSLYGYALGKRTAWFSGKMLLNERDVRKCEFWKTDYLHNVRYYSTFHIKHDFLKYYIGNLQNYKPEYLVGFPSTMLEIAKYGLSNNLKFNKGVVKAIFPTAETLTIESRKIIESFFNAKIYDQYASSEGAPFIIECKEGCLHLEMQSGIFEVLDDNGLPARTGELVVTSFTTYGTPLIRYRIGDIITLMDEKSICACGNQNPKVSSILGRVDDFIYSLDRGKISLVNISNCTKGVSGLIQFQISQNSLNAIVVNLVVDNNIFNKDYENIFLSNLRDRLGTNIIIDLVYVNQIDLAKSGKFRLIQNNIKSLL